jgi:hypothetical protein
MSVSYQSKDSGVQEVCLAVQELTLQLANNQVVSTSGSTVTISINEQITNVANVVHYKDSDSSIHYIPTANRTISGSQVTVTLTAALAAADALYIAYSVAE